MNQGREPVAKGPMSSVVAAGMHYIREADGREELFLLDSDPEEGRNMGDSSAAAAVLHQFRQDLLLLFKRD